MLPTGDRLTREDKAIVVRFAGARRLLSTSVLNGGCRTDLSCLFNYCEVYGKADERCTMRAATYEEHLCLLAEELGLDPLFTTGLSTAAKMKYAQINSESHKDFSVTVIATGGIDVNGSRAGDPALWHEHNGRSYPYEPGTINILVFIDAKLKEAALTRALVTVTEAKTAALQEVLAPSCYSRGLATGSGTDGTIIVSNLEAPVALTDAGQHSKLGEYIGRVVKNTVKAGLTAENGFISYACSSILRRIGRFGITEEGLWGKYCSLKNPFNLNRDDFRCRLMRLDKDSSLMALAAVYAHILDLLDWNLIDNRVALRMVRDLLKGNTAGIIEKSKPAAVKFNSTGDCKIDPFQPLKDLKSITIQDISAPEMIEQLVACFSWFLVACLIYEL